MPNGELSCRLGAFGQPIRFLILILPCLFPWVGTPRPMREPPRSHRSAPWEVRLRFDHSIPFAAHATVTPCYTEPVSTCKHQCGEEVLAKGLCRKHYDQARRGGPRRVWPSECSVDGCEDRTLAKGLCSRHYAEQRRRKLGVLPQGTAVERICSVEGCELPLRARGLCAPHYIRHQKGQPLDTPLGSRHVKPRECAEDGCCRMVYAKGKCRNCYVRDARRANA